MILEPGDIAVDYSFARPTPAAMVAANVRCVCRYISPNRNNKKNLTVAERDALLAAGLSILLVWENSTTDPLQGAPFGTTHGQLAGEYARLLGYPPQFPIIIAVDFDTQSGQVETILDYCTAFKAACGYPVGVYGEADIVSTAALRGVSTFGWQTVAWSHKAISPQAHCLQHATPVHPSVPPLGAVDDNMVLQTFKAWSTIVDPPDPPTPNPQPSVEDDMLRLCVLTDSPARLFAMCDSAGRALRCEWTGPGDASGSNPRIEFYRNATPAGQDFEMHFATGSLINISLDGVLPPGLKAEQFANADEIVARQGGAVDPTARAACAALNDSVGRIGQSVGDIQSGLIKAGGG